MSFINMACTEDNTKRLSEDKANDELEGYMRTFNEIEMNLDSIIKREEDINLKATDGLEQSKDAKEAIIEDIALIDNLMIENHKKIDQLLVQLVYSESEFQKMVARLNRRVKEEDKRLADLKMELEKLNFEKSELTRTVKVLEGSVQTLEVSVDTLTNKTEFQQLVINKQSEIIKEKNNEMNTGFVAIGSSKELMEKQVIYKEGGFLGLGTTEKLKSDPNNDAFEEINIKEIAVIPFHSKRAELVTPHPAGSYVLAINDEDEVSQLIILDPGQFWNSSKYLVVKVN
jgi:predicted RNase H-like nuclease (RuvC/YqgF family)